jgi:hypothetical protein
MIYFSEAGTVITDRGIALQFQPTFECLSYILGYVVPLKPAYRPHPAYEGGRTDDYRRCPLPPMPRERQR